MAVIDAFHHIHHSNGEHIVHHCGADHPGLFYEIHHCECGLHSVDVSSALGHDFDGKEIAYWFKEECPHGGWHVESGELDP